MDENKTLSMKKPCDGCPFKRINSNKKPNPGGSEPVVYLGQARGPFWLPCHNDKQYDGKNSDPKEVRQCAGAAIFRANCKNKFELPKQLLKLPEDKEIVFTNEAEFFSYYLDIPIDQAKLLLSEYALDQLMYDELNKVEAKRLNLG